MAICSATRFSRIGPTSIGGGGNTSLAGSWLAVAPWDCKVGGAAELAGARLGHRHGGGLCPPLACWANLGAHPSLARPVATMANMLGVCAARRRSRWPARCLQWIKRHRLGRIAAGIGVRHRPSPAICLRARSRSLVTSERNGFRRRRGDLGDLARLKPSAARQAQCAAAGIVQALKDACVVCGPVIRLRLPGVLIWWNRRPPPAKHMIAGHLPAVAWRW